MSSQIKYWLAFNQINPIGPIRHQRLLDYFGDLKDAWQAPRQELIQAGIEPKIVDEVVDLMSNIDSDQELEKIKELKINLVTILDENYPKLLKEIYAPPPLLYYFGAIDLNNDFPLAVVGSRKISSYGKQITQDIVSQLAQAGLTIISGLALGIDGLAHQATLDCQGKTLAVLGSGLDKIYPASNRKLAEKIIAGSGSLISEFPLGMPPLKYNFPQRNRIISGLALGVLITEAGSKSGALITANHALEQNREVYAVPGNIYQPGSQGTNQLIKAGAKMVTSATDILELLNLENVQAFKDIKQVLPDNEMEKILLEIISFEPIHIDKLAKSARLDISVINSTLAMLEMKGAIKNLGGQKYVKAR